jgi:muconate cycloisomerase
VARVRAVREAIGPRAHLGVDANGGWGTADVAIATIGRLREFDIYFVEQPTPPGALFEMARVRAAAAAAKLPVVADESCYTLADAHNLAEAHAADVVSIYIGKAGGIGPALEIATSGRLPATIGSNLELGIGSAAMAHFALATPTVVAESFPCDIIGPFFYEDDVLTEPLPIKPGEARVHERPGLGVELDEEKVEKYRVG